MKKHLAQLTTRDPIWKPIKFDRVEVCGITQDEQPVQFSIIPACFSEYAAGPNLCQLANVAGEIFGPGFYGLKSCRRIDELTP